MIPALWKKEWKSNYKILLIFAAVLTMYTSMIVMMFDPKLGDSLNLMMESMPQLFAAFGMASPGNTLLDFLINYLYGFLYILFPLVLILLLANRLLIRYTDRGSMAYLLAAPVKRTALAWNQLLVAFAMLFVLLAYLTALEITVCESMFPGELDIPSLLLVNAGLLGLYVFFTGLVLCCACVFNESKWALGASSGLCIAFVLVQMLSQAGDQFEALQYATPLTLFAPEKIIAGEAAGLWGAAALYLAGIALACAGTAAFSKKDLSI